VLLLGRLIWPHSYSYEVVCQVPKLSIANFPGNYSARAHPTGPTLMPKETPKARGPPCDEMHQLRHAHLVLFRRRIGATVLYVKSSEWRVDEWSNMRNEGQTSRSKDAAGVVPETIYWN
jgi:hypothetical protein